MRYDWKCTKCSQELIVERKMADSSVPPTAEEAGQSDCEHSWTRLLRTGGFVLQGSGWFKDGYDGMGNSKMLSK